MESEGEAHNVIMLPEIKPQSPSSSQLWQQMKIIIFIVFISYQSYYLIFM